MGWIKKGNANSPVYDVATGVIMRNVAYRKCIVFAAMASFMCSADFQPSPNEREILLRDAEVSNQMNSQAIEDSVRHGPDKVAVIQQDTPL
jgi:hypothetical protein